jgi:prevent-host-death family protein
MVIMKTANVTTLRTHLSRILDAVRRGEEVEILDRKVPIARLVPITPGTESGKSQLPPWLEQQRRAGVIKVGSLKPYPEILKGFPPGTKPIGNLAVEYIIEERRTGR